MEDFSILLNIPSSVITYILVSTEFSLIAISCHFFLLKRLLHYHYLSAFSLLLFLSTAYALTKAYDLHDTVLGDIKRCEVVSILFLRAENMDGEREYIIVQVSQIGEFIHSSSFF